MGARGKATDWAELDARMARCKTGVVLSKHAIEALFWMGVGSWLVRSTLVEWTFLRVALPLLVVAILTFLFSVWRARAVGREMVALSLRGRGGLEGGRDVDGE